MSEGSAAGVMSASAVVVPAVASGHSPATMDYYDEYHGPNNGQTTVTTTAAGMNTFLEHSGHQLTSYTNAGRHGDLVT
jgi:hypothetical protein